MSWSYPLASTTWDSLEYQAIQRVIDSGQFSMGKEVQNFEAAYAKWVGSKYCVMCSSGSTANLLMVAALFYKKDQPLKRGDEVIVPAVSWSTTYYPLYQYGLKIKFVDIDPKTFNYDLTALERAISPKTRLIMAVNLLGNPNDFSKIKSLMDGKQIYLIEDNCESMGALFNGKSTGTFGQMGTFSCFFSHHISTMEGGGVTTNDEELYHILLSLRAHGWTRNLPKFNHVTGEKSDDPFEESFKFVLPGYNVRPLEMSGAIGVEQIKKIPKFVEARRENAKIYQKLFSNHPHLQIQEELGQSSWFGFSFILKHPTLTRKQLTHFLMDNKVECRPIVTGNFAKNPVIKYFDYEIHEKLPNADLIDQKGLFVGNHHFPLGESLQKLSGLFEQFFG